MLKGIDLFAGIGGFRIAMNTNDIDCVFTSEWDLQAQQTYKNNFGDIPSGDITKIKESDIPQHDILCGGFPCQAFSVSGKQQGFNDTRGTLFFDIIRIAKHHKPKVIFLENVKNLLKHDSEKTFKIIKSSLEEIGYDVYWEMLNSADFGSPTARKRVYIVCFRKDLGISNFSFPKKTNEKVMLKDFLQTGKITDKYIIVRDDINLLKQHKKDIKKEIDSKENKPIQIGYINKGGQGERIYSPYGVAITLSSYGGGAASKTGAYLINNKVRKLTPRECANIMGFPQDFIIHHNDREAHKQFGNSVVVPVVQKIMNQIIKYLGDIK